MKNIKDQISIPINRLYLRVPSNIRRRFYYVSAWQCREIAYEVNLKIRKGWKIKMN